jgi:Ni,Fe-hydrogenase III small subunit
VIGTLYACLKPYDSFHRLSEIFDMLKILDKIYRVGVVTEPAHPYADAELDAIGIELKSAIDRRFKGSLAIRQVDAGSCNGCELEIHALNNAFYDLERFGVHFVASPRHADILLVTGPVSKHMQHALLATFEATPDPKWVVAIGTCAANGGEFGESYASCGAVHQVLPVHAVIPGCPPTPTDMLRGLLNLIQ